jgi:hypothetical protein
LQQIDAPTANFRQKYGSGAIQEDCWICKYFDIRWRDGQRMIPKRQFYG